MTVRRHARRLGLAVAVACAAVVLAGAADARHPQAGGPDLPRHRGDGVAQRHRRGRTEPLHHRPRPKATSASSRTARSRRSPTSTRPACRSPCRCCSTPAPAWSSACTRRRTRPSASPSGCGRRTWPRSWTSTRGSRCCRTSPPTSPRSRTRYPRHPGRRLDVDVQRALHLAQGAGEDQGEERRRRAPPGHRPALGRRGHLEPGELRGGARPGQAVGDGHLHDRPAVAREQLSKGFREAEFVLRQLAQETGGRAFFPQKAEDLAEHLRRHRRRAVEPVHAGLRPVQPAPRRRLAPPQRAGQPPGHAGPHQARLLRAGVL